MAENVSTFANKVGRITVGSGDGTRYIGEPRPYSIATAIGNSIYCYANGIHSHSERKCGIKSHFIQPTIEKAKLYLRVYKNNVQRQYPFLEWNQVLGWFNEVMNEKDTSDEANFFIYMIFALGTQLESFENKDPGLMRAYYDRAFKTFKNILEHTTVLTVQGYLLLAIFSQRMPNGISVWETTGLAMRTAVSLGLHRNQQADVLPGTDNMTPKQKQELVDFRSRVFWSVYGIERINGLVLGRPFSLSDVDIDAPLPTCIPEMEVPCAVTKLRQIQSHIATLIYEPDNRASVDEDGIEATRIQIVLELNQWVKDFPYKENAKTAYEVESWPTMCYHNSLIILLRPVILHVSTYKNLSPESDIQWFRVFAESASAMCLCYYNLYERGFFRNMWLGIYNCYAAGISFLCCVWIDKDMKCLKWADDQVVQKTIDACTCILDLATAQWPNAHIFKDAFAKLVNSVCYPDDQESLSSYTYESLDSEKGGFDTEYTTDLAVEDMLKQMIDFSDACVSNGGDYIR